MKLKSIEYSQYDGRPEEWRLERCSLGNINLIVGKNATGKTKTLNIINALAKVVAVVKKIPYDYGNFRVVFDKEGEDVLYMLQYENKKVINEYLSIGSDTFLDRKLGEKGKIFLHEINKHLDFKIPEDEVAAMAKRDALQYPFFEHLFNWGDNLMHFSFGSDLGKNHYAIFKQKEREAESDFKFHDTSKVAAVFKRGKDKVGNKFAEAIKTDMNLIGYQIEDILIDSPTGFKIEHTLSAEPMGLLVKESDLVCYTDQFSMSQGMFRALSVIIQINYSEMARIPSCILIDDIGEGLDYDRSIKLIKLIVEKAEKSHVQLIMATNDRFVMNNVPLQYWSIIQRQGNKSMMINYENSPERFDKFELTGLSNFDFFSSNYFLGDSHKE